MILIKAQDSAKNFNSKLRESANFSLRGIRKICREIGPRIAGSESEMKAQESIMETAQRFSDEVIKEEYKVSPSAFYSWTVIDGVIMMIASVLFALSVFVTQIPENVAEIFRIAALVAAGISLFLLVTEFLLYKQVLDPFMKKATSSNVICKRKATGEVKRRIIFTGHVDSCWEWRYTHLGGANLLRTVIASAVAMLFVCIGTGIAAFFVDNETFITIAGILHAAGFFIFGFVPFFLNWKNPVVGANDNLTGVFNSLAMLQYLDSNDIRFENTEVWAVSMGSEEIGLRGAKHFAKTHKKELSDVETVCVVADTICELEYLSVYNKDMNGIVKLDKELVEFLQNAAKNAGYDLPLASVYFGSSDSTAFAQNGYKTVTLAAMDPAPARYYHTRRDTDEILDLKAIEAGVHICVEAMFMYDENGLKISQ